MSYLTIPLNGHDVASKRLEIKKYFLDTFDLYESLFSLIKNEHSFFVRYEPLRHPLIFYYAHTAVFFTNKLIQSKLITQRINPLFESTMSIGVDEMSWDDLDKTQYDWPTVVDIKKYRDEMRTLVSNFIDKMNLTLPIKDTHPAWIILMGIEHERIHLETSSAIMRQMPLSELNTELSEQDGVWKSCKSYGKAPINQLLDVQAQEIFLGKNIHDQTYGWDNELGSLSISVPSFQASKFLVSNEEFLEFVQDKGYKNEAFWTKEGWQWANGTKANHPKFWIYKNEEYMQRNLLEIIPLPLNWPVEVNQLEADAFCQWKSQKLKLAIQLPSEEQWYAMTEAYSASEWNQLPANIGLSQVASSSPIDQFQHGDFFDLKGNVWQWTNTPIMPFPGFKVHPIYDDFSVPTFDGRHNLIKGGSWISTGNETLKSARFAFRRHFFQHAGFRYIASIKNETKAVDTGHAIYETDDSVAQYIEFHYGDEYFSVANFPKTCVEEIMALLPLNKRGKCLDLGCSVGRSAFEFAQYFDHVDGVDFSARFIQVAHQMQQEKRLRYEILKEGQFKIKKYATLDTSLHADKINFVQGDACNLKASLTNYGLVFAGNLIDRLYDPKSFLENIYERILPNGHLALTSPYTWLAEFTPTEKWIGENNSTLEGLKGILVASKKFKLVKTKDIPFIIRETSRKYQHSIAEMSLWQKI